MLLAVDEFIVTCPAFVLPEPDDPSSIEFLWSFFDVPRGLLDVFIRVNPTWDGEKLRVRASLQSEPDALDAIRVCIKHYLRFCDFSETR